MGSFGSNRAPCGPGWWWGEGSCRGCPIHGAGQDLLKDHRIGCVTRRTPLAPSHIMARLAKWYYDAPSSDGFVFHLGHVPVFIAEVVNVMAPYSLGFGINSINSVAPAPTPAKEVLPTGSHSPCLSTTCDCK